MLLDGIRDLVLADQAAQSACGGRFFPLVLPESGVFPATTYQRISQRTISTLDGHSDATKVRLQVDHWGERYGDVQVLAAAVDAVLEDFTGALPDGTWVYSIAIENGTDRFEEQARLYRFSRDYMIQFSR